MTSYVYTIIIAGIIFLAMIINLALKKEYTARITGVCILVAAIGGLVVYGYGFSVSIDHMPLAVLRSIMAVCGMFTGKNDFSAVKDIPILATSTAQFFFWLIHMMAQYATASAVIATLGARVLHRMRLWLACFGNTALIYGVNEDSVAFGKQLAAQGDNVVFVDDKQPDSLAAVISGYNGVVISEKNAPSPDKRFLSSLGIRGAKRKYAFYALNKNYSKNMQYALMLKDALESKGINAHQTAITMLGDEEAYASVLRSYGDRYGFGNVTVLDPAAMSARLLMQKFPPCNHIAFKEDAAATENFQCAVIGFGKMGQAVMKQLVMNGQFEGSDFRMDIFAPDRENVTGYMSICNRALLENYDINFYTYDGRSQNMFRYLKENKENLKYIVICAGETALNNEIGAEITRFLTRTGAGAQVYLCEYSGVTCLTENLVTPEKWPVYTTELLCTNKQDQMAMSINHYYSANDSTIEENWNNCDYFSRMSSRASADFIPSMLKTVGKDMESAGEWGITSVQLENMAKTEHLRWCAFHYAMGYEPMPMDVYMERIRQRLDEKQQYGYSSLRFGKDSITRQHICLVDWDELDNLSQIEKEMVGNNQDYKQKDRNNVLAIPQLIAIGR